MDKDYKYAIWGTLASEPYTGYPLFSARMPSRSNEMAD